MRKLILLVLSTLIALSLGACGGGSSGGSTTTTLPPANSGPSNVVKGMASKGPIDGTAKVYALNVDGSKGSLLATADVKSGAYEATIGSYSGPVLIEVSGSYRDEATGKTVTLDAAAPLRAAVPAASGTFSTAVTPLTELAVRKAGALTPSNIEVGNKLISDLFKIDIINILPVAPTSAALGATGVTQSQKDYTLALAAISQLSLNRGANGTSEAVSDTIASLANGISSSGMAQRTVDNFQTAAVDYLASSSNSTGITSLSPNLADVGTLTVSYKLGISTPAGMAAHAIRGLQFEIILPAGLTLRYDTATGEPLSGVVTMSKPASDSQPYVTSKYTASSNVLAMGLITTTGMGAGDLATITCSLLPNRTAPSASSFGIRNVNAAGVDDKGNVTTLTDVKVTVN